MDKIPDVILVGLSVGVFVGGTVWALAWWLSGQFSEIRSFVYQQMSRVEVNILDKLEYHEKHDDSRFDDLNKELWDIKIRLASKNIRIKELERKGGVKIDE
jgi:hypothetical protein